MAIIHVTIPIRELSVLAKNSDMARISPDSTHIAAIIEDQLHILVGDFTGIETAEDLSEIIAQNFQ